MFTVALSWVSHFRNCVCYEMCISFPVFRGNCWCFLTLIKAIIMHLAHALHCTEDSLALLSLDHVLHKQLSGRTVWTETCQWWGCGTWDSPWPVCTWTPEVAGHRQSVTRLYLNSGDRPSKACTFHCLVFRACEHFILNFYFTSTALFLTFIHSWGRNSPAGPLIRRWDFFLFHSVLSLHCPFKNSAILFFSTESSIPDCRVYCRLKFHLKN